MTGEKTEVEKMGSREDGIRAGFEDSIENWISSETGHDKKRVAGAQRLLFRNIVFLIFHVV